MSQDTTKQSSVDFFRCLFVVAIGWAVLNINIIDAHIMSLWEMLSTRWWFRHDSFEPALSTACFIVFLPLWMVVDVLHQKKIINGMATYRIDESTTTSTTSQAWKAEGHFIKQFLVYVVPIFSIDYLYPRRGPKIDFADVPTAGLVVRDVLLSLFLYDLFFTITHYTVHRIPSLYSAIHAKHHDQVIVSARDTIRLSISEEVIDVLCSVAALSVSSAHPLSRAIYDIIIVFLLCELHSGWSFPFQLQHVIPYEIWGGSVRHAKHHLHPSVYYQKFFTYIDDHVLKTGDKSLKV